MEDFVTDKKKDFSYYYMYTNKLAKVPYSVVHVIEIWEGYTKVFLKIMRFLSTKYTLYPSDKT